MRFTTTLKNLFDIFFKIAVLVFLFLGFQHLQEIKSASLTSDRLPASTSNVSAGASEKYLKSIADDIGVIRKDVDRIEHDTSSMQYDVSKTASETSSILRNVTAIKKFTDSVKTEGVKVKK